MTSRRFLRPTAWTLMAAATAGVVLAAKPVDRTHARNTDSAAARAERITVLVESVLGPALQVPENLENHRLKIRLAPHLRGRLLPNGQLLSLNGHDLTELSDLFTTMGARLTPAVKVSEADINRLNARAPSNAAAERKPTSPPPSGSMSMIAIRLSGSPTHSIASTKWTWWCSPEARSALNPTLCNTLPSAAFLG